MSATISASTGRVHSAKSCILSKPAPNAKQIAEAEYAAALAAGRIEAEIEIRARAVRYVPERDAIEIVTNHNAGFLIPRQWIGALDRCTARRTSRRVGQARSVAGWFGD